MQNERKATDRKRQIIEAFQKSFSMFGYKATTMDLVAKLAGVGKGTIYTFFATKDDLFAEIIQQIKQELREISADSIDRSKPFFDNLTTVIYGILQHREQHELFIKLTQDVREIGTPLVKQGLQQIETDIVAFIVKEVEYGVAQGDIHTDNPELTGYTMFRLYLALTVEWSKTHPALSEEQIARYFTDLFKKALS
ncbi:TetR/AcrR family transcriptional regulator [Paenibacillaceae bacterium]|nr:TetR/AcrR family transcriptional regulator [Paenibacillaceae bacterium]